MPRTKTRWVGINKHNKSTILRFADDNRLNGLLESSIENRTTFMVKLVRYLKSKRFEDATVDDLKEFFKNIDYNPLSQRILKINIKGFYKWLYGLEKDDPYPDVVRWIKFKSKRQLLKEKDVDAVKLRARTTSQ